MIGSWYRVLDGLVKGATKSSAMKKMLVDQVSVELPTLDSTLVTGTVPNPLQSQQRHLILVIMLPPGVLVDHTEIFMVANRLR